MPAGGHGPAIVVLFFNSKALSLDPIMVTAWIGYGHAYAAVQEHEHAMSAYNSAARYAPG